MDIKHIMMVLALQGLLACNNASIHAIDEEPKIKIDDSLLGIWKAEEDPQKENFVFIQSSFDVHSRDNRQQTEYHYYVTYMNNRGTNPGYQQFTTFMSHVGDSKFLNIGRPETVLKGYLLVRLLNFDRDSGAIVASIVSDTTIRFLNNSKELKEKIRDNLNNPTFYKDTFHFVKVSSFHGPLNKAAGHAIYK